MDIYWWVGIIEIILAFLVGSHAVLYKRDSRSSTSWALLILLVPWVGMLLYLIFGVNRIERKAPSLTMKTQNTSRHPTSTDFINIFPPFRKFNDFNILQNGDEAFPEMLGAIDLAKNEVLLSSYIFDNDQVGARFVKVLQMAVQRGVAVYVLVDGIGIWYSIPRITSQLKRSGIPHAVFLPTFIPWSTLLLNLRNHRKLLVVDRQRAFIGGINIREGHWLSLSPRSPVHDVHFSIKGGLIEDLVQQFSTDWEFATNGSLLVKALEETLPLESVPLDTIERVRVLSDGPDLKRPLLASILLITIAEAKSRLRIVTPYFIPDRIFIAALTTAALRGIEIDIIVSAKSNLPWMTWAMRAQAWQLLEYGIRMWETTAHFDHSKIFVADDHVSIVGSSNWDSRSFRLNFELNLEIDSVEIAKRLNVVIDNKLRNANRMSLEELNNRTLPVRFRDSLARLFLPVL